jgi:sigma-B regulation protein RsbU (phosphoserine phosphatase)
MMMCQVAIKVSIASLAHSRSPEIVLRTVNSLLVENVRGRMSGDDHMTLVLLRCSADGAISYAGGHEPMLHRTGSGEVRLVATPGPWLGLMSDLPSLPVSSFLLEKGDVLWLYTDGVTEAPSAGGELFGEDRLEELVDSAEADVATVVDAVMSHIDELRDDVTVMRVERLK